MGDVSTDCLRLLMRAWPIIAPAAFDLRLIRLERSRTRVLVGDTEKLAVSLEQRVRELSGRLSLDIQSQLRDRAWFDGEDQRGSTNQVALVDYLRELAEEYLTDHGSHISLRDNARLLARAREWGWLMRYLPADILISSLNTQRTDERMPPVEYVRLAPPQLRDQLRDGITQEHLHLGAGQSFTMLWTGLMQPKYLTELSLDAKDEDRGDMPFRVGAMFQQRLTQAGAIRLLLARFLYLRQMGNVLNFDQYMIENEGMLSRGNIRESTQGRGLFLLRHIFGQGKGAPGNQSVGPLKSFIRYGFKDRTLDNYKGKSHSHPLSKFNAKDPISRYLYPGTVAPEIRFNHQALRYLCHQGKLDEQFSTCFWQYQRVRCALFRFLIQEPGVVGFDWFRRFYSRIGQFTKALDSVETTLAMCHSGQDAKLTVFEGRKAPASESHKVLKTIQNFVDQARGFTLPQEQDKRPEIGLVLHFVKDTDEEVARQEKLSKKLLLNLPYRRRHHFWYRSRARQARALHAVLRNHPEVLLVLRGIDVANRELTVGTWATARVLLPLREESRAAAAKVLQRHPEWNVEPLRLTYHTGEEFRRLSEGLRRTHELLESRLLKSGDRLGHGLALGLPPKRWANGAEQVAQPADERLDDLLWELDRYATGDIAIPPQRIEPVRREALELAAEIYGPESDPDISIENLRRARALRHEISELRRHGYGLLVGEADNLTDPLYLRRDERSPRFGDRAADRLLSRYLYDEAVFRRGQRPVLVSWTNPELDVLEQLQRWLLHEFSLRDITIESNPSSNLLIGAYQGLEEHPVMQLQPIGRTNPSTMPISINDDNSLTFATCIADEYAHVFYALQRQGVGTDDALRWLKARQKTGWRSRFTLSASANLDALNKLFPVNGKRRRLSGR